MNSKGQSQVQLAELANVSHRRTAAETNYRQKTVWKFIYLPGSLLPACLSAGLLVIQMPFHLENKHKHNPRYKSIR